MQCAQFLLIYPLSWTWQLSQSVWTVIKKKKLSETRWLKKQTPIYLRSLAWEVPDKGAGYLLSPEGRLPDFQMTILYLHMAESREKEGKLICFFLESEVAQSCPTLCDSMDCSPPGSSVHGLLRARILEWVAISFSRGSSWPRDWTGVSCIAGRFFNVWATKEAPSFGNVVLNR